MVQSVTPIREPQSAAAVLMVRPANFAFNPETAASNAFQSALPSGLPSDSIRAAWREFDALADKLTRCGVDVVVAEDSASPIKPDAVFPNNWVSFHADGTVVRYPMLAPNRRLERREDILEQVAGPAGFRAARVIDLSHHEAEGKFLEGTGSLVLDRVNRLAYACLSPRTDLCVLAEFAQRLDYEPVTFAALDAAGAAVYHTNVLMAVGSRFAVVCGAAIVDARQRAAVSERLQHTGHRIIDITQAQMQRFAGNLLELAPPSGPLIALSSGAWQSLEAAERRALEAHGSVLTVDLPVIEAVGGGGVRCMLAEIHLPRRDPAVPVS